MRQPLILLMLIGCWGAPASAHHAFAADYEPGNEGQVEGVITEVIYKNPHARYYLEVTGIDGEKELWDLQTMNLMMLGRVGWTRDTLQVGDRVKVEGILGRDNARRMSISVVTVDDGRVISPQRGISESNADLKARGTSTAPLETPAIKSIAANITPGSYVLDENHAYVSASYSHLGLSNQQLQFRDFQAQLELDGKNMEDSHVFISIDASSVSTALTELDDELKSEAFFDVETYPEIRFESSSYQEHSESTGVLTGDLTIVGETRPVVLDVTINSAAMNPLNRKEMIGFSANGVVNRSEFGLTAYTPMISDELSLNIQVEFERSK